MQIPRAILEEIWQLERTDITKISPVAGGLCESWVTISKGKNQIAKDRERAKKLREAFEID